MSYVLYIIIIIPEQFTAIGPLSFIWRVGEGGGEGQKIKEHFQDASAWGVFV